MRCLRKISRGRSRMTIGVAARALLVVFCVLTVAGCNRNNIPSGLVPAADKKAALHTIDLLRTHQYAALQNLMDPSLRAAGNMAAFRKMAGLFPAGPPRSRKVVGAYTNTMYASGQSAIHISNLTFEYAFADHTWLLVNVVRKRDGSGSFVSGMHVFPRTDSLEHANRFTLAGKSPLSYLVLALAVLLPILIVFAFVVCIRTPLRGRKWPWMVFILFGIGGFTLNWSSGHWHAQLLHINLLGSGIAATPFGPWIVTVALPLGAIVFLALRHRLRATGLPSPHADE